MVLCGLTKTGICGGYTMHNAYRNSIGFLRPGFFVTSILGAGVHDIRRRKQAHNSNRILVITRKRKEWYRGDYSGFYIIAQALACALHKLLNLESRIACTPNLNL